MINVRFGSKDDDSFELEQSQDLIAIRTRSQLSLRQFGTILEPQTRQLEDAELVLEFPDAGVEVYRVPLGKGSADERKSALRSLPDVRFAGSVLIMPKSGVPVIYTENLYVRFDESLSDDQCERVLQDSGLTIKRILSFASNAYFVSAPEGIGQEIFSIAEKLLQRDDVVYCHPELVTKREVKAIYSAQWHLISTVINGLNINAHANVLAAHQTTEGEGITIAVIDDGVDVEHPEFVAAGKVVAPRDATLGTNDGRPKSIWDKHGTACAGVACAQGTDKASGVAPQSRLMPIRLNSALGSINEAEAFRWAVDHGADIISCSWGPEDGPWYDPTHPLHQQSFPLPASTRDAIDYAISHGRNGKGCVICWAAGNGNESVDLDGYASYHRVIAVAACNDTGRRSAYSDFGDAIWCSFPSSDVSQPPPGHPVPLTKGIWTTDVRGNLGYNPGNSLLGDAAGDYTIQFGGTSSACPGAAGVAALILSANPNLRYFEVRSILARCCDQIDPSNGNYDPQTGRSPFYGHGRLNAATAVQLATSNRGRLLIIRKAVNEAIPDLGTVEATVEVANDLPVDDLAVHIRLKHTYIGDLLITLIPPDGAGGPPLVLHRRSGGTRNNLDRQYDSEGVPEFMRFRGQTCAGTWTFRIEDKAREDSGLLEQVSLMLTLPGMHSPVPAAGGKSIEETPVLESRTHRSRKSKSTKRKRKAS